MIKTIVKVFNRLGVFNKGDALDPYRSGIKELIDPVYALAKSEGFGEINLEYLIKYILVDLVNPNISKLVNLYEIDLEQIKKTTQRAKKSIEAGEFPKLTEEVNSAISKACLSIGIRKEQASLLGYEDLLLGLLEEKRSSELLKGFGLTILDFKNYLSHGDRVMTIEQSLDQYNDLTGDLFIVIMNDDYTPMDLVIDILKEAAEFQGFTATAKMVKIHTEGQASLGPYPESKAKEIFTEAITMAREQSAPLRLLLEKS